MGHSGPESGVDKGRCIEHEFPAAEAIKVGCFGLLEDGLILLARTRGRFTGILRGFLISLGLLGGAAGWTCRSGLPGLSSSQQLTNGTATDRVGHKEGQHHSQNTARHCHNGKIAAPGDIFQLI